MTTSRYLGQNTHTFTPRKTLFATTIASMTLGAVPVIAQEDAQHIRPSHIQALQLAQAPDTDTQATQTFAIPAQALTSALDRFSELTGISFAYTSSDLADIHSQGVVGDFAPRQALDVLLAGTGVSAQFRGANTVNLAKAEEGVPVLQPLQVIADAELESDGYQVDRNATAMRIDVPIMETPKNVQVINQQVINDQQASTLLEVMRNVGGVSEGNNQGRTTDRVMLRGFEIREEQIYADGFPDLSDRSIDALTERVEVLRGSSSLLYGDLSAGGLINVIKKKPEAEAQYLGEFTSSNNGTRSGLVDATGPLKLGDTKGLMYRLIVQDEKSDYWRNFGEIDRVLISPMVSWQNDSTRIDFAYRFLDRKAPFDRGTVFIDGKPANIPAKRRLGERSDIVEEQLNAFDLQGEFKLAENWSLRVQSRYQDKELDNLRTEPKALDETTGDLVRQKTGLDGLMTKQWNVGANVVGDVQTGIVKHTILVGAEYQDKDGSMDALLLGDRIGDSAGEPVFNIFDPIYGQIDAFTVNRKTDKGFVENRTRRGYYLQDQIKLGDSWTFLGGIRYSEFDDFKRLNNGTVREDSKNEAVLPRGGFVYRPVDSLSFWGSYSESFEPNESTPEDTGAPFDPEEGVTMEAGIKYEPWERLRVEMSYFNISKENVAQTISGSTQMTGEVESAGFDLNVNGDLTERMSFSANLSLFDTEIVKNPEDSSLVGNQFQNAADKTASLFLRYNPKAVSGLSVGGGLNYIGERPVSNDNDVFMDDYTLVDAFVSYATLLNEHSIKLQLNVKNVLDEEYFPSSVGDSLRVSVGEPRSVWLNVSLAL